MFVATIDYRREGRGPPSANASGLYALNATTGEILWRVNDTRTAPVVAGDRVFTSHYPADPDWYITGLSDYGNVSAHNATTGERIWTSDVQGEVVAYADGRLFVTDEPSKTLTALDASDGSRLWRTTVGNDFYFERVDSLNETNYYEGELAATDDAVYLTIGFAPREFRRGYPTMNLDYENATARVSAYAADDGAKLWEQNITTESGTAPASLSAPAVANGTVYVTGGSVYALNAETGATQLISSTDEGSTAPAVANGTVYVGGSVQWKESWDIGRNWSVDRHGGWLYVVAFALDASDGNEMWNLMSDISIEPVDYGSLMSVVADGQLYLMIQRQTPTPEYEIVAFASQEDRPPKSYRIIKDLNTFPVASIDVSPLSDYYAPNTTVTLNASDSVDLDGEIVSYEWDIGGDSEFEQTGQAIEVTTAAEACDVVTVTLRVTDDEGITDETTVTLQTEP